MRKTLTGILAGIGMTLACGTSGLRAGTDHFLGGMGSGELPSGTGQRVRGGDRRQGHRRDHAVAGFPDQGLHRVQRQGQCLRHGRRRLASGSAPAPTGGHYVDLTEFFNKHKLTETMAPATVKYYAEYPADSGKYWAIPAEGDAVGWSYRKDWFEDPEGDGSVQGEIRLRPRRAEGLQGDARHRRILPPSRREAATASRSTPTTPMTRW